MMGENLANIAAGFLAGVDLGKITGGSQEQEDCLFLDVVVPGKALRREVKVPVLNWIYGGSYIHGSKDGMNDGTPLVKASKGGLIYVAGNYRLGSLGFLAGSTMEKEESATTNVGFYDQRAILEWIQKYIVRILIILPLATLIDVAFVRRRP
jgi:carboxylesterase type B